MLPQIVKIPSRDRDLYLQKISSKHILYLDGDNLATTEQLIKYIYSQIPNEFPYWLNWDVVWDVLTDLEWDVTMVIENCNALLSDELWEENRKFKNILVDLVLYEHNKYYILILQ